MTRITDVRTTIYEWVGPVAPMPPHFCTTASDLVSDVTGSISGFRFLGWLVVEIECDDGTVGIGNAALAPVSRGYGCFFPLTTADIVVDLFGVWTTAR